MLKPQGVPDGRKVINKKENITYRAKEHDVKVVEIANKEVSSSKKQLDELMARLGLMGISISDLPPLNPEKTDKEKAGKDEKKPKDPKDPEKEKTKPDIDHNKIRKDTPGV